MLRYIVFFLFALSFLWASDMEKQAEQFIQEHIQKVAPLYKERNLVYWEASATGKPELYEKLVELELKYRKVYMDSKEFETVKGFYESKKITSPLLKRQIELIYLQYLQNQIKPELMEKIVKLGTAIEEKFNTHRATFEGKEVSDNVLGSVLKEETDLARRKSAWEAAKSVGELVSKDVIELVKLRNEAAKSLGYKNFYVMSMFLAEQDAEEVLALFDTLAQATQAPFTKMKKRIDTALAARYKITPEEMLPYHYQDQFFQDVQDVGEVNMDAYLKDKDVRKLIENFYNGMGLPVTTILDRSDLYEKEGKYQHAYCIDIDREGDVRVMLSIKNNRYWMETLLHELGHATYSSHIDRHLPWFLREEAHTFITEAIAQMFEILSTNPSWLKEGALIPEEAVSKWQATLSLERKMNLLIFAHWSQVMVHFEKDLYENPDQDLNKLWWDYVEKYQHVKRIPNRNKPDWAAKIHLATVPVYYHNYMLGNLLVSQLMHSMAENLLKEKDIQKVTFLHQEKVGKYLKAKIFFPGKSMKWNELIFNATNDFLNPKYFAQDVEVE